MSARAGARDLVLLAVVLAAALAWPLASPPIMSRGEAREGMIVRDVVTHGHWVLGYRQGVVASKPPLYHWVAAAGARCFGVSDVTVRLPSALAAGVLAATTLVVGTALGGRRRGWLATGALLGTIQFWRSALEARVDMVFAAAVAVALGAFVLWHRSERRRPPIACYLGMLAAVLAKGPVGLVLVPLVIAVFLGVQGELRLLRRLWSWPLATVAVAGAVGWYVLAYRAGGHEFLATQVLRENVDRLVGRGVFRTNRGRTGAKLPVAFAVGLLPWNLTLLESARRRWRGIRSAPAERFLHVWWMVVFAVFLVAAGKRSVYLLPLFPAVALLAAGTLERLALSPRVLAATVVAIDLAMLATTQAYRVGRDRRESLTGLAAEVRRLVPAGAAIHTTLDLNENEHVVLGYLLDRPLDRRRVACPSADWWLAPGVEGARRLPVVVAAQGTARRQRRVELLRCVPE